MRSKFYYVKMNCTYNTFSMHCSSEANKVLITHSYHRLLNSLLYINIVTNTFLEKADGVQSQYVNISQTEKSSLLNSIVSKKKT